MSERIITDSRGQRWDVVQQEPSGSVVFRHQSGRELQAHIDGAMDGLSTDQLLDALDAARREQGLPDVGHAELDVAFDEDGYETGR